MASQPYRTIPGPGGEGGGGRDKRRSFLPGPLRSSGIPSPTSSAPSAPAQPPSRPLKAAAEVPRGAPPREGSADAREVIPGAEKLRVGERVFIGGVKPGFLRYVGRTHIAPGFWCGIELFDASGLHDGEVDGQRYFTCKPFRGIFAPVDKVVPDESPPASATGEKAPQGALHSTYKENSALEVSGKPSSDKIESYKIPGAGKYQSGRSSGLPRGGQGGREKGGAPSAFGDSAYISAVNRRSYGGQEAEGNYRSRMNPSHADSQETSRAMASEEVDGYSRHVKEHLQSDSRRYFNLTFGRDTPPLVHPHSNLPDLLSSVSPPSLQEDGDETIPGQHHRTSHAQDGVPCDVSDIYLGFREGGQVSEESGLLEAMSMGRAVPSTSESDASLSGQSSTLEDTSVATVNEVVRGDMRPVGENRQFLQDPTKDADSFRARSPGGRQSQDRMATTVGEDRESAQRKDNTGRTCGTAEVRVEGPQEDGSSEVSPEVSQVLEWDYDHDAFDGKLLEKCQDGMSTSTSESCSESSAGTGAVVTDKGIPELDTPAPQDGEGGHEFEENEDGFETIDNIEDFSLGMGREAQHLMTDSGISEKEFQDPVSDNGSRGKSVEFDTKVSVVSASLGDSGVGRGRAGDGEADLQKDLMEGHRKQERPLSLLSTASADTGYVADTDTEEAGTLTANSPMDWNSDKQQLHDSSATSLLRPKQQGRGSSGEPVKVSGVPRDLNRENAERLGDRHFDRAEYDDESEESEEEEEEEEEETSEEETTSEEEEEEEEDDDEEDESEEESEEEEESEDDRIEADRNAPNARSGSVSKGSNEARVAAPVALSGENQGMTRSAVVGNEMTESSDTVPVSERQGNDSSRGDIPQQSEPGAAQKADQTDSANVSTKRRKTERSTSQKQKKKKSSPSSAEDKKIVAEHKKAIKSASSRLADYIKAPLPPPKPKEEKADSKSKKTKEKKEKKKNKSKKTDKKTDDSKDENSEDKKPRRQLRVREEKPKVKRTVVKSKWGNIMSQIEASKSTVKIKPKAEIQSSLALYLSTPATPSPKTEGDSPEQKEPPKPKPKPKLIKHPKPDFSNVKSKLNITPPVQLPRRDSNANASNNLKGPGANNLPKGSGKPVEARSKSNVARKPPVPKFNAKEQAVKKAESLEKETAQSQGTGSCTSLTAGEGNAVSRAGSRLRNTERASSVASNKSDNSTAQRSVKSMNVRNAQKSEQQSANEPQDKKATVKSTIPPATPRRNSSAAAAAGDQKGGEGDGGTGIRASASPPKATPARLVWGAGPPRPSLGKGPADQTRARTKGGNGLKSGHPPDVVSTSARGSHAQEVARLESLCEARTKELTYTKLQLKDALQAFDALACLLNYCTTELDAFSCPTINAKLQAAMGRLTEQQQSLESLSQEKVQVDEQLQQVTAAKDAAQQEVSKLKEEMQQAVEAHSAAQQQLQEEQAASLKAQVEEVTSQHQETLQQMQKYQEKQVEYTRHSHKRQLMEVTSEHQMATNQLKLLHLEEIQELRNKHELQVEELHVQHRKKLEDITQRFESIKLSLTEKVQSLCVECDELRIRAKSSEEALQRDADVKVQLALTPYLHLPKEIESLKTVIDMRTEEIQKLRRQNMDLVKQLQELPIAQEKVVALQQKVENLQAIINIKTDHEKQLHEKCQVLMRKYDREFRANKRLSMDYEQVMWRMSQSADLTGSMESISPRHLSRSPSRGDSHSHGSSPVHSLSSSSQGGDNSVVRRHRKASGGDDSDHRRRANTFCADTSRHKRAKGDGDSGVNGSGSSRKQRVMSKSGDYSGLVHAKEHEESFSSGHESGDTSDFFSSLESNVILETAQGVSFHVVDKTASDGAPSQDKVFSEEVLLQPIQDVSPTTTSLLKDEMNTHTDVTVVVTKPSSQ